MDVLVRVVFSEEVGSNAFQWFSRSPVDFVDGYGNVLMGDGQNLRERLGYLKGFCPEVISQIVSAEFVRPVREIKRDESLVICGAGHPQVDFVARKDVDRDIRKGHSFCLLDGEDHTSATRVQIDFIDRVGLDRPRGPEVISLIIGPEFLCSLGQPKGGTSLIVCFAVDSQIGIRGTEDIEVYVRQKI